VPALTPFQENAKKLAESEGEWAELGPIRQIDFSCTFSNGCRDERASAARIFAAKAQDAGFQVSRSEDEHGFEYSVTASARIEPTAERVTELQILLTSFVDFVEDPPADQDPALFLRASEVRWSYPPKEVVSFWPNDKHARAVNARFRVMCGDALVQDPLRKGDGYYTGLRPLHDTHTSFALVPSEFLKRAQSLRPKTPQPTASAFSQWVYSLYSGALGNEEDRVSGTEAEKEIWARRKRSAINSIDNAYLRRAQPDWMLTYNGLHLREQNHAEYLTIPHLKVNDEALRASPDLVYSVQGGSELIIVEIKFSQQLIPKNLWPNIWAQLWCYAQLDTSLKARKVTVIGEIWGRAWPYGYTPDRQQVICLRALVRRDPRVAAFDRFFRRLFDIYAGRI
jgi:hypothetical protein